VLLDDPTTKRFEREVETLSRVDHPSVVRVIESGSEGGRLFLAMQCLEGGSLARRIHERRTDPTPASDAEIRRTVRVVLKIARAAAAAHGQGIVHRDIKPSNILFDDDGEPHLADFGLVHLEQASTLTTTERVLGTAAYLAPERLLEPAAASDPRVDVFSLGVTLFEAIAGVRPFQGKLPEILAAARRGPPPLRLLIGRSPGAGLDAIVERCLADRPRARYASATELADDLEAWLSDRSVRALNGARRRRATRWVRLHPWRTGFIAGAVLATAALIGTQLARDAAMARRVGELVAAATPHVDSLEELAFERAAQVERRRSRARNSWRWSGLPASGPLEVAVLERLENRTAAFASNLATDPVGFVEQARLEHFEPLEQRADLRARAEAERTAALETLTAARELAPDDAAVRRQLERVHLAGADWCRSERWRRREGEERERLRVLGTPAATSHPPSSLHLQVQPAGSSARLLRYVDDGTGLLALEELVGWSPTLEFEGLDAGSYVVELRRPGARQVTRHPVLLGQGETQTCEPFELPTDAELDGTWAFVPPGPFLAGGDPRASDGEPLEERHLDGFFIGLREVTCGEYFEFLRDVHERGTTCLYDPQPPGWTYDGPVHVPREGTRSPPSHAFDALLDARIGYYQPASAVHSISLYDARHYVAWLNERALAAGEPWTYAIPSGDQWEKAARGADGRSYPWGEGFDWSHVAGGLTRILFHYDDRTHMQPGRFPVDTSPYGLVDTAGNVRELCSDWEPLTARFLVRGGEESFYAPDDFRLAARRGTLERETNWDFGLRLVRLRRR
jgi:formylglycine-generating enzyme required for sulfatase activity